MEENNRKGPGIFYAVVGVATLIVAIIGATFAYFTATGATNTDKVTGTTASGANVSLEVTPIHPVSGDEGYSATAKIVPLESGEKNTDESTPASLMPTALSKNCIDAAGNVACQVYKATVTNGGTGSVNATTTLQLVELGNLTNMRWQLLDNTGAALKADSSAVISHTTATPLQSAENLAAGASAEYFFVVWLEETGAPQTAEEQQTYKGTVSVNVVGADGQTANVTATFK